MFEKIPRVQIYRNSPFNVGNVLIIPIGCGGKIVASPEYVFFLPNPTHGSGLAIYRIYLFRIN